MTVAVLPEIQLARRAFPTAQQALSTDLSRGTDRTVTVGWHDSSVNSESGSFAVVNSDAAVADLIGEILAITANGVTVYAYVLTVANVPTQLSVTRRVFLAMSRLTVESLSASVGAMA